MSDMSSDRQKTLERLLGDPVQQQQIFRHMFKRGNPQQWARWLRAPLEHACGEGDADLVDRLLEAGADGSAEGLGEEGRTLLHAGAASGSERVVWALLNAGGKPDIEIKESSAWPNEDTPLQLAVRRGHEAAAKVLIAAGADVSGTLAIAIARGDEELAYDLLLAGADPNEGNNFSFSPLLLACRQGFERLVRALLQKQGVAPRESSPLHAAVLGGNISTVKSLIAAGFGVNAFDIYEDCTPLHTAVSGNENGGSQVAIIDFLIAAGADVNAQLHEPDGLHESPLHTAAATGNREGALALLRHGADVNGVDDRTRNLPLHLACHRVRVEVAELLLRWGADETAVNRNGETAIEAASASEHLSGDAWHATRERLVSLLRRAPNDRAWRRRGFFALCRAHPRNMRLNSAPHSAAACRRASAAVGKAARKDSGGAAASGGAAVPSGGGGEVDGAVGRCFDDLAAWVMGLQEEGVFRHIVGFL